MAIVNHDFPLESSLLVTNLEGTPIQDADIRIYTLTAYEAGVLDTWVASTISNDEGKWVDPVALPDGESWVVHFQKLNDYGPEHREITT